MDRKYEVTAESIKVDSHTLYRIKALRCFSDVKAGDLGGWIESEGNLGHDSDCWIDYDAMVYGDILPDLKDGASVYTQYFNCWAGL